MRWWHLCAILLVAVRATAQPHIVRRPWYETAIDSNAITIEWQTDEPTTSRLEYGSSSNTSTSVNGGDGLQHGVTLTHLTPQTAYYVRLIVDASTDTVSFIASTASDYRSSGVIEIYFNREIDTLRHPLSANAHSSAALLPVLDTLIHHARHSIDLALYSFSGKTGNTVRGMLRDARARGIRVRVIADSDAIQNSSAWKGLINDGVPAITNAFGAAGSSWGNIHHNKFIVIDARDDSVGVAYLLTGSWNLTDQQTITDYQNVVVIQDLALAKAYEREFEEEWGSATDTPDSSRSRFSFRKTDNTPRSFNIAGRDAHVLFSPNGGISNALQTEIGGASSSALFAMYQFTQSALASSLISAQGRGVQVHGIVGAGGSSDQFSTLQAAGVDVLHYRGYQSFDTLFHHKFAVLDPGTANGTVLTGSYNWTKSAEEANNENELILMYPEIARDYFSEWISRYQENGGTATIELSSKVARTDVTSRVVLAYCTNGAIDVNWSMAQQGTARLELVDELGIRRFEQASNYLAGRTEAVLHPSLTSGAYYLIVYHDNRAESARVIILK